MTTNPPDTAAPVIRTDEEHIAWLTLNRPQQRNPLSADMIAALRSALEAAEEDPGVRVIVIAAEGPVVSACNLAVASDEARFCTPGVNIGTFCTTPLVGIGRNVHRKHAMELALTGDMISAQDAVRFGLVNRAVPAAELVAETRALAQKIASRSAQGIRRGKAAFYRQVEMPLEEAFRYANEEMLRGMTAPGDAEEGTRAFLEKRRPLWGDA